MTEITEIKIAASHVYIHIPFCVRRCSYCDFYSVDSSKELMEPYIEAVIQEIGFQEWPPDMVETVYIGGGTPTILSTRLIRMLAAALKPLVSHGVEVTIEANPMTVSRDTAECLIEAGINRVSLGVQSFQPVLRENLGRQGRVEDIYVAIEELRRAGFENISIDLIFGVPGQDRRQLQQDIEEALSLEPAHISYYELTVKNNSYASKWEHELGIEESLNPAYYKHVVEELTEAGYRWYETSNLALPGKECRHNIAYWNREDFIGVGAGAWSTVGSRRWQNVEDLEGYITGIAKPAGIRRYESITETQVATEYLMLGLRKAAGINRELVANVIDENQESLLASNGLLVNRDGKIFLTSRGRYLADEVCARLLRD